MAIVLTQHELERLLARLRSRKTELETVDAKMTLTLKTSGDKARFIRHVAALANTGKPSYLVIGVEDGTWNVMGLPAESSLLDVDGTQQRMNHVLSGRLDPGLTVQYRTYTVTKKVVGVVAVRGKIRPYLVAVEEMRYGGGKTGGGKAHIERGAIYVRQGTSSVAVNRQRQVMALAAPDESNLLVGMIIVIVIGIVLNALLGWIVSQFGMQMTPDVGAFAGVLMGVVLGGIVTERLSKTLGGFLKDVTIKKYTRYLLGVTICALNGAFVGYRLVASLHQGELEVLAAWLPSVLVTGGIGWLLSATATLYVMGILDGVGRVVDFFVDKRRHGWKKSKAV